MKDVFGVIVALGMFVLMIIGLEFILDDGTYYKLPNKEWKCEKTVIVNDDITKVECVNYIKKEK